MGKYKNIVIDFMDNEMIIKTTIEININTCLDDTIYEKKEFMIELTELLDKYKHILNVTKSDEYSDGTTNNTKII